MYTSLSIEVRVITLIAQKGGTGKTTLAINLAVAAEAARLKSVIIDIDPQASAASWGDLRKHDRPVIAAVPAARLDDAVDTARSHGADIAIIDTAPHSEGSALSAARAADLSLIPLRPGILDLRALKATSDICMLSGSRTAVILNQVPPRGRLADQAAGAVRSLGLEAVPHRIGARVAFNHSLTAGLGVIEYEPHGRASDEIQKIHAWIHNEHA